MAIEEIMPMEGVHMAWKLTIQDVTLVMERYGNFCTWEKIILRKNSDEIYTVIHESKRKDWKDVGLRTERFFGKPLRNYCGDQISFVEFVIESAGKNRVLKEEEWVEDGFSLYFGRKYKQQLEKMLADDSSCCKDQ